MARFQAEIPNNLHKNLVKFLDSKNMTKADFLKLAIQAKEQLSSKKSKTSSSKAAKKSVKKATPAKKGAVKKKATAAKKKTASALVKKTVAAKKKPATRKKATAKKTASAKKSKKVAKKAPAKKVKTVKSKAVSSMGKIIETNIKLYDRFAAQAKSKRMSLQAYAKKLGLDLKKIERVKKDKSVTFVPKLKEALDQ